ncbi:MAG: hypothetical protein ACLU99_07145 [Alphaproteobacteria bacterium]
MIEEFSGGIEKDYLVRRLGVNGHQQGVIVFELEFLVERIMAFGTAYPALLRKNNGNGLFFHRNFYRDFNFLGNLGKFRPATA